MTLVVSEVSKFGFVMVGDSALTVRTNGKVDAHGGGLKVFYLPEHNIGLTAWGAFKPGEKRTDFWLTEDFIPSLDPALDIEGVASQLALAVNALRRQRGTLGQARAGFHVAGYQMGVPKLWHVHTGHEHQPVQELRLYKDIPEGQHHPYRASFQDPQWLAYLDDPTNYAHLRNGAYEPFAALFGSLKNYREVLKSSHIDLPKPTLKGHVEFHKMLVKFVGQTLAVAEVPAAAINTELSTIAFNNDGLQIDERIRPTPTPGLSADTEILA